MKALILPLFLISMVSSAQKKSAVAIRDSTIISNKDEQIQRLEKENAKKGAAESIFLPKLVAEVRRQDSIIAVLRQELLKKGQ